ncbi:MAG: helix-turn-helix domain-containing protein [Isosphaeraceae bacterium]
MATNAFGDYLKRRRIALGRTLRAFCQEQGFDHGNYSRMERGVMSPPHKEEKLAEYAGALGIERGSDEWMEFCDLASVARGEIPKDLVSDKAILGRLPVLFQTLRDSGADSDKLDELVEKIRRS